MGNSRERDGVSGPAIQPMLNEDSFMREVSRTAAVHDFGSDTEAFARALWPIVSRLAESAWIEGRAAKKKDPNPYANN